MSEEIGALLELVTAGEWGNNQGTPGGVDTGVIRSANFTKDHQFNTKEIVVRSIEERKRQKKLLRKGDILIEKSGGSPDQPVGRVLFYDLKGEHTCSNFISILRPSQHVEAKFLYYSLCNLYEKGVVKNYQQQTTGIINLQLGEYLRESIYFPPLPEQKKIASVLTHLDGTIETTQKQINKLHDLKKATTNELLTKGIDNKEFKESELGRIPNDWESVALGEFCREIVVGHVGSTSEHYIEKDGVRFIRTGDLKDGKIRLTETKQITREFHHKLKKSSLKSGDVLVSRVGDTGQAALVPEDLGEANCANIIIIRCGGKLLPQFLRLFINSEFFFDQVARVSIGSAQAVLNVAIIKQLLLSLPSVEEQRGICSMVHELENLIGNLKWKLAQTQTLKKSLMQDLLSGHKRVSA